MKSFCIGSLTLLGWTALALGGDKVMSGKVVDQKGDAVANATVYINIVAPDKEPGNIPTACPEFGKKALSDADGNFSIDALGENTEGMEILLEKGEPPQKQFYDQADSEKRQENLDKQIHGVEEQTQ